MYFVHGLLGDQMGEFCLGGHLAGIQESQPFRGPYTTHAETLTISPGEAVGGLAGDTQ